MWAFILLTTLSAIGNLILVNADEVHVYSTADTGNWSTDCILSQFAVGFNILVQNETYHVEVPPRAVVNGKLSNCGKKEQQFTIKWTDPAKNSSDVKLFRNLTLAFTSDVNTTEPSYGVKRIFANIQLAQYKVLNRTFISSVDIDTDEKKKNNPYFLTPLNRSFLCEDVGKIIVHTHLHHSSYDLPDGELLPDNATIVTMRKVQLDAFRSKNAPKGVYQVPIDCDYRPNNVVPIIVGVILALLVAFILIAYIIGKRRMGLNNGYESL